MQYFAYLTSGLVSNSKMEFVKVFFLTLMFFLSSLAEESKPKTTQIISSLIRQDLLDMAKNCPEDWDVICTIHVFSKKLYEFKNRCIFDVHQSGPIHEWDGRSKQQK